MLLRDRGETIGQQSARSPREDPNIAPEAPGSLVVLDVRAEDRLLDFAVTRWDPGPEAQPGQLFVLWRAKTCPLGYKEVANGVVCVAAPPTYDQREYEAWPRASLDPLVLSWEDADTTGGGLMLVAALPEGYGFAGSVGGAPDPVEAKPFDGRMALFWRLSGMRVDVSWRISPLGGGDLRASCAEINERLPPPPGAAVEDPPPPPAEVLQRWAATPTAPIAGPPPSSLPSHTFMFFENVGQIGAAGHGAQARDFTQVWAQLDDQIDLDALADALADLRVRLREQATDTEHDRGIGLLADAEEAARRGDGPAMLERLRSAGSWVRDTATSIGAPVVTAALKAAFGLA